MCYRCRDGYRDYCISVPERLPRQAATKVPADSGHGSVYQEGFSCEEHGLECRFAKRVFQHASCCDDGGFKVMQCVRCHKFRCQRCGSEWETFRSRKIETVDTRGLT